MIPIRTTMVNVKVVLLYPPSMFASANGNLVDEVKPPKAVSIDPEGDVYLMVGDTELQVSSKVLSLASKVFKALFQVNFQEGAKLAEDGSCRIKLPDDDVPTMQVVNLLLHHRQPDIPIDTHLLQNVAIAADKYACTKALCYWAKVQVLSILKAPSRADSIDGAALFTAYVFDFHSVFWAISKRMVLSKSKSLLTSEFHYPTWGLDETARQILPRGLLGKTTPCFFAQLFCITWSIASANTR